MTSNILALSPSWVSFFWAALLLLANAAQAQPQRQPQGQPQGQPESRLDGIVARGVLRVGTTGDYPPFSFRVGASGEIIGIDVELAADLARALGVKLELVPTSWPRLLDDFGHDAFDLAVGGVSVTLDRQKVGVFSTPYLRDGKTPITRCENQARFRTLSEIDRSTVRLIVNPGGTNERFARARTPHALLTVAPDNLTIFERLIAGEADVMITDAIEARLQQRLHPQLCAVHPDTPFDLSEKAILIQRDWVLAAFVDQWLHQAISSGAVEAAVERWLAFPWGLERLRQLIDARLLLARDVARAKWNTKGPIEDLPREQRIIEGLGQRAAVLGLPSSWAESFFRAQIEASKTVQRELFAQWHETKAGRFEGTPDLAKDIRPALDALTPRLLSALAENAKVLQDPAHRADVARALGSLDAAALSPAAVRQAVSVLTSPEGQ